MDVMKRWSGWSLWALFLACAPGLLESQDDCELKELVVGEARGRAGERVEVELLGSASCEVTGFILAIGHDTSRLSFVDAAPGEVLLAHAGDDLFFGFDAQNAQGYAVVGAVFDLSFPLTVPPTAIPAGTLLATLNYEILPGAAPGVTRLLNRTRTYGPGNPVSNVYSRRPGEPPLEPRLVDGAVTIEGQGAVEFKRGDANGDRHLDISDGIFVLHFLFLGGAEPGCHDGADANDSGHVEISDAIALFAFLFLDGQPLPAPGPSGCGPDPTEDALDCAAVEAC